MADPDYFTLAAFRTLPDMDDEVEYTEAKVLAAAAYFVEIVEREVDRPLIPRNVTEELDGNGRGALPLSKVNVRSLTTVSVDGATVDPALLTGKKGRLRYKASGGSWATFPRGVANVVVVYSAGETTCPPDIKDAVMWATRDRLLTQSQQSGSWDRKSSETSDYGTVNYVLPGEKRPTGYPDLDAAIASYIRNTKVTGFA